MTETRIAAPFGMRPYLAVEMTKGRISKSQKPGMRVHKWFNAVF